MYTKNVMYTNMNNKHVLHTQHVYPESKASMYTKHVLYT